MEHSSPKMLLADWFIHSRWNWIYLLLIIEVICIYGDYYIKKASMEQQWSGWKLLLAGSILYAASAVGFFFLMRMFKVFTVGMMHSYAVILLSIFLSLVVFKEKINAREIIGLSLGVISIYLLVSFEK